MPRSYAALALLFAALLAACPRPPAETPAVNESTRPPTSHRAASEICTPHVGIGAAEAGAGVEVDCASDADCGARPGGFCKMAHVGKGTNRLRCHYDECNNDTDCGRRGACACRDERPHGCVPGECKVDRDCPAPGFCAYSMGADVMTPLGRVMDADRGYYCRTARDTCADDEDCRNGKGERCAFVGSRRRWECRAVNPSDAP